MHAVRHSGWGLLPLYGRQTTDHKLQIIMYKSRKLGRFNRVHFTKFDIVKLFANIIMEPI